MREKRMHDLAVRIVDPNTLHIVQPRTDGTNSIIALSDAAFDIKTASFNHFRQERGDPITGII